MLKFIHQLGRAEIHMKGVLLMIMKPVTSSDIASIGYDGSTLHILFNSGGIYQYTNVPHSTYSGLMSASSHGKYFHAFIKGRYGDTRIG